ncbi:MAG: cobaltochelatase subunit CobN, partial [Mesorhizobium sp.]|nr:cobaltochelatase subunit CobN [Mesorhizobium sp.]
MHILATTSASLDDLAEPIDLRQTPADVVALSFTDSDLAGLAAAWKTDAARLPSMRLAALRDLRHPMSVDLWIDSVARHAKVVLVRILGGYDWWRYGCDQLAAVARERGIKLALLPGESHDEDLRLIEASTLPRAELDALLGYFREGGPANMAALVQRLARLAGAEAAVTEPVSVPKAGYYQPGLGVVEKPVLSSVSDPSPPSLSCRTSPPQRGRSAVTDPDAFSSSASKEPSATSAIGETVDDRAISPLEGEMSGPPSEAAAQLLRRMGRTERGATELDAGKLSTPIVPILFYRSMLLAADVAPIDALVDALKLQGLAPAPIFVSSLKDPASSAFVEAALASLNPAAIITATAFASGAEPGTETLFDRAGVPVFQVIVATTRREVWEKNQRGLAPADLAMHVVLPELDGRILAGAISFKGEIETDPALAFRAFANRPEADRVAQVARRVAAFIRLQQSERAKRTRAILIPDYPSAPGRTGDAVGLDVPSSVLAMLHDLKEQGYTVDGIPQSPRELLDALEVGGHGLSLEDYLGLSTELSGDARDAVKAAWGSAEDQTGLREAPLSVLPDISPSGGEIGSSAAGSPLARPKIGKSRAEGIISPLEGEMSGPPSEAAAQLLRRTGRTERGATERRPSQISAETHFPFRAATFGNITVALAPDRGRSADRRADYHDPTLPPRHELIAFGLWLRKSLGVHAIIHVGAHGTLEWLPGKTVALSETCFPEIVTGSLPVIYPFIVSNPGEAAQAKRRISAVTLGHLPPPLTGAGLDEAQQKLERLVDEYAQADGLDRRRRDRLAKLIVETAQKSGLATEAGVARTDAPDEALRRIDAWLCDLKDFAVKDGLHVYGRGPKEEADPLRRQSAEAEKAALLAALDGRHIKAGPAGAPARGRSDVLPTGRNLFTSDPRTMPTPTAYDLGQAAAEEVVRSYMQSHGDWPRSLVIDLW